MIIIKIHIFSQKVTLILPINGFLMMGRIYPYSTLICFTIMICLTNGYSIEYARTSAVNIFVFVELFFLFSCKELRKSIFKTDILNNKFLLLGVMLMVLFQWAFTHSYIMNTLFQSVPLELGTWVEIIAVSFGVIFVVEIKRYLSDF